MREGSQNSSVGTLSARYRNPSKRPKMRECLKNNDGNVFVRLGHRRQSAFERFSDTYSPSTTKSGPDRENSRDRSHSRGRPHRRDSSSRDRPRSRDRSCSVEESYGNTCSSYEMGARHGYHSRDRDRSRSMKRGRPTDEEDLAVPWTCEEVDPFTPRIRNFKSSQKTRMPNNVKTYDGTGDLEDHVKIFQAAAQVERWHRRIQGSQSDLLSIFYAAKEVRQRPSRNPQYQADGWRDHRGFHIAIQGEAAAASKKKGHTSWKPQDQPKRHVSEQKSDYRGQPREGRGLVGLPPLTRTPKEIFMAEAGKFKPPPSMVTPIEKRCNNKFCDFHNDKGYSTDESHRMLKFPVDGGIVTIRSTILIPAECVTVTTSSKEILKEAKVCQENFKVALHLNFPDQDVAIGGMLSTKGRTELCSLLK
ncbi:hypothetical protein Tco_0941154 [Tanacetum coccineum]|uniref:Reverse transcriptase domain-containing protein n=1 Tax=Tanacetum coccineum TaxID=301880 RepID=A0ABQ5DWQ7_9ASTR